MEPAIQGYGQKTVFHQANIVERLKYRLLFGTDGLNNSPVDRYPARSFNPGNP
jgi:hypothetical protein